MLYDNRISDQDFKLGVAAFLFFLGLFSAVAPRFALVKSQHWFSMGNMMSSGVLLGAGLVHQLPEAQEALAELAGDYPWAGVICGCTFSLFLVLEELMHLFMDEWSVKHNSSKKTSTEGTECTKNDNSTSNHDDHDPIENQNSLNRRHSNCSHGGHHNEVLSTLSVTLYQHNHPKHDYQPVHNQDHDHNDNEFENGQHNCGNLSIFSCDSNLFQHHHHEEHIEHHLHGSAVSSIALMFALSIHSMLAGFTLGLQPPESALSTAVAIVAHKMFEGYALGSTLSSASDSINTFSFFTMVLLYALCTPLAIVVAVIMSETISLNEIVTAGLQAAVAGTFLYISIVEVGMKELLICRVQAGVSVLGIGKRLEIAKLLSFIVGYAAMCIMAIYI